MRCLSNQPASLCVLLAFLYFEGHASAGDWPHWRGPQFNGISSEADWSCAWPKDGPPIVWKAAVGTGFASVAVSGGRLFTIGNHNNQDTVYALDAATGAVVWKHDCESDLGEKFFEGGPTATPTVDGSSVILPKCRGRLGLCGCRVEERGPLNTRRTRKSSKYQRFQIPEVWLWRRNKLEIFALSATGNYEPTAKSRLLSKLDPSLIERCVAIRSWRQARQAFRAGLAAAK